MRLDDITMRLGLWLIGGRETPREKDARLSNRFWEEEAKQNVSIIEAQRERLIALEGERDEAIKQRDGWRARHHSRLDQYDSLSMKYLLLNKRHDKLKASIKPQRKSKSKRKTGANP